MVRALQRQMEEHATSVASQSHSVSAARSESNKLKTALTDVARQVHTSALVSISPPSRPIRTDIRLCFPIA